MNILCPRERRVFQSKLVVSSSNQYYLHHSPQNGYLEKRIKKRVQSFSDTVYMYILLLLLQSALQPLWVLACKLSLSILSRKVFYRVSLPAALQTPNLEDQCLEHSKSRHLISPRRICTLPVLFKFKMLAYTNTSIQPYIWGEEAS